MGGGGGRAGCWGASAAAARAEPAAASPRLAELLGPTLVDAQGKSWDTAQLGARKIGLYFSAEWCPPCRTFTPHLAKTYAALRREGKPFEIVFVSSDRSEADMRRYMANYGMPWKAVPFSSSRREELGRRFKIRGIPSLVIVDANGKLLTANGRDDVGSLGAAAYDRW